MNPPTTPAPTLSVIIPARKCREDLHSCLKCLDESTYRDFEVIVVDDASPDDTAHGIDPSKARVLVLQEQSGPGIARNTGAEHARGTYLLFLDADVCVHPNTLETVVRTFEEDPTIDAIFGSYDTEPTALNMLSQYRNLMHHFVHQEAYEEASTFWSGCGAIRRSLFLDMGGFHPDYRRPCIEDIELGVRLRKAGHRIRLNKNILVTHRKRWTFWGMLKADIRDRAFPWSQLILREGKLPNDLNLRLAHRVSALLACGLVLSLVIATWYLHGLILVPVICIAAVALIDSWSLTRRVPTSWRYGALLALLGTTAFLTFYFQALVLIPIGLLLGIILLNWRFYAFLARTKHPLFAALAVPLQILHYVYSVGTFACASVLHWLGLNQNPRQPAPKLRHEAMAYGEIRPDSASGLPYVAETVCRSGAEHAPSGSVGISSS